MKEVLEPPKAPSPEDPLTLIELRVMELQYQANPLIQPLVAKAIERRMLP